MTVLGDIIGKLTTQTVRVDFMNIQVRDHAVFNPAATDFTGRYGFPVTDEKGDTVGERYSIANDSELQKAFSGLPVGYTLTDQDKNDLCFCCLPSGGNFSVFDTLILPLIVADNTDSARAAKAAGDAHQAMLELFDEQHPTQPPGSAKYIKLALAGLWPPTGIVSAPPPSTPAVLTDDQVFVLDVAVSPQVSVFKNAWLQKVPYSRMKQQWPHPGWPWVTNVDSHGDSFKRAALGAWLGLLDAHGTANPVFVELDKEYNP